MSRFAEGDIVGFVRNDKIGSWDLQVLRTKISSADPYKLIVLKVREKNEYLVAVCKDTPLRTQLKLETTIGRLYVRTKELYIIDEGALQPGNPIFFRNEKQNIVKQILDDHKRQKRKKDDVKTTDNRIKQKREKRRAERYYSKMYEIAALTNDRDSMQVIKDRIGYLPVGKGSKSKSKTAYEVSNPRPYSGGRFSPK